MRYIFEYEEITNCSMCPFCKIWEYDDENFCELTGKWVKKKTPNWCPLVIVR